MSFYKQWKAIHGQLNRILFFTLVRVCVSVSWAIYGNLDGSLKVECRRICNDDQTYKYGNFIVVVVSAICVDV